MDEAAGNPYEAPAARVDDFVAASGAAELRREHLGFEAGLRTLSVPCLVYGLVFAAIGGFQVFNAFRYLTGPSGFRLFSMAVLAVGVLGLATAWGYAMLRAWVRVPAAILAVLVLLTTLLTTLPVVAYAGWLTWSARGRRVLAPDYRSVRAQASELRAWTRPGHAVALLVLLGVNLVAAVLLIDAGFPTF